jgi:uroporphyrinogen decarboxylase
MTSRERVLAALNHEEPDRVPIDFGAMRSTGIMGIAYNRLKAHLGIREGATRIYDLMQQLAEPEPEVAERMGADVIQLHRQAPCFGIALGGWKPWTLPDGSPCEVPAGFAPEAQPDGSLILRTNGDVVARMPAAGLYFEMEHFPLAGARTKADVDAYEWPIMSDEEVRYLRRESERLRADADKAVLGEFGGNVLEGGQFMWGWARFMELLADERPLTEHFLERLVENHIANLDRYIEAVGDRVDICQVGDDLGTQEATQLSPRMYRELIWPRHRAIYQHIREHSRMRVFLHSCGSIAAIIPDLIEAGVEILNPVQTSARGMDPAWLKREFGKDLTFWGGGADTQHVLPHGSVREVVEDVRTRVGLFKPGGGYVFTQVHNIQADVSPENTVAAYETAKACGVYGL